MSEPRGGPKGKDLLLAKMKWQCPGCMRDCGYCSLIEIETIFMVGETFRGEEKVRRALQG
jgi:hypothetical protein